MAGATAVGMTACSSGGDESTSAAPSTSTASAHSGWTTPRDMPAGKGSNAADGAFPRTVAHFAGSSEISAAPKKVAVLSTGQADALLTLGMVPAGSTAAKGATVVPKYLYTAFPDKKAQLDAVADLGSRDATDVERIAQLEPDLILVNGAGKDMTSTYDKLSKIAPTVVTQGTGLHWKEDFLLVADAVGKRQAAQTWLNRYQQEAASWGKSHAKGRSVSLLRKNGDRVRVFGVASFGGSVAEDAGLPRPASQQFTDKTSQDLSGEQLTKADGGQIFYGVQGGDASALTKLPLWSSLQAVGSGHTTQVDDDMFYLNTGPAAARGILSTMQETLGK